MRELLHSWTRDDFKIDWFSGSGAGGQHRNKHQNCVRITHKESGLTAVGQSYRSRDRNFKDAFHRLGGMLKEHYHPEGQKERAPVTEVIRTYNVVDNRVKDHISGEESSFDHFDMGEMIIARKKRY